MQKTLEFIEQHKHDNVRELALKSAKNKSINLQYALEQIEGWQIAEHKIPTWAATKGIIYPPHLSMEQCSSEETARYKQRVIAEINTSDSSLNNSMADLTGGFGIDCSFIGSMFKKGTYVERQEHLCKTAESNFNLLNLKHIEIINTDGCQHLETMKPVNWLYLDPARRSASGKKTVLIEECEPNIIALEPLILDKSDYAMIKLSPMLDLFQAVQKLGSVCQIHVVAVRNECKELLLILSKDGRNISSDDIPIHTFNISADGSVQNYASTISKEQESDCPVTDEIGAFLYEPNSAILKAGLNRSLAARFGITKLHHNSQLYTSNALAEDFPGRIFKVDGFCSFGKKELKELTNGISQANITVRNFPSTAEELKKRLKLKDGGSVYLFATTTASNKKTIIRCSKK